MQTFVPYPDFTESAYALSGKDLTRQIDSALTVLDVFHADPVLVPVIYDDDQAVLMWRGFEPHLAHFGLVCLEVAEKRGLQTRFTSTKQTRLSWHLACATSGDFTLDKLPWMGNEKVHASHRSELKRRCPSFYGGRFASTPDDLPVIWPVA